MKKLILTTSTMLLSGLALLLYNPLVADIHYHAGFRVYKDGQLQDFSGPQYMHLEMCSVDEGEHATPIEPGASVIIVAGDESGVDLTNFVSSEYIQRVESLSETCGS